MWQTGQMSTPMSLLGFSQFPAKSLHPLCLLFPMQDESSLGKFVLNLIAGSAGKEAINLGDVLYHCTVIISVSNYLCTLGTTVISLLITAGRIQVSQTEKNRFP